MTPREARRERRAAERKTKKAEIRKAKADLLANPDLSSHHYDTEENGFVSQNELANVDAEEATLLDWIASARNRNFPNGLPAERPAAGIGFVPQNEPPSTDRAAINRANAQLSTGPRSSEGKVISSRNSTKHGLASGQPLIPGEDPEAFAALLADLLQDHRPANRTEELLVKQMAQSHWLEQRAIRLQNDCFTEEGVDQRGLALFLRYGTTHNRAFHKALADLQRLQKERRKAERVQQSPDRGFVSYEAAKRAGATGFVSQAAAVSEIESEFVRKNRPAADPAIGFVSQSGPAEPLATTDTVVRAA